MRWMSILLLTPLLLLAAFAPVTAEEGSGGAEAAAGAAAEEDAATGPQNITADSEAEEEALTAAERKEKLNEGNAFIQQIKNGGVPMGFLIALAVVGVVIIIERLARLNRGNIAPPELAERADEMWSAGDTDGVKQLAESDNSALGRVIAFLAENKDADYIALNEGAGEVAAREIQKQQQMNYWLAVVATISPLLGLLGTVLGMISAFKTVAVAGDIGDTSMVAEGIYMALSTTAAGLIIAIPTLGFFHYLKGRASQLALELEDTSNRLILKWFGKAKGAA
ncbi:MAG: MotA/TolQ/ExbB proton channel family protein [Planctomycetota bacterium]